MSNFIFAPRFTRICSSRSDLEEVPFNVLWGFQLPSGVNYIYIGVTLYLVGTIGCLRR